jgi:glucosamine-phosphate N-acetyltransferase
VEEIAVAKEHQGKGLGLKVLAALTSIARKSGCYKNTLGCSPHNKDFYVKCGYEMQDANIMSEYYEEPKVAYERG